MIKLGTASPVATQCQGSHAPAGILTRGFSNPSSPAKPLGRPMPRPPPHSPLSQVTRLECWMPATATATLLTVVMLTPAFQSGGSRRFGEASQLPLRLTSPSPPPKTYPLSLRSSPTSPFDWEASKSPARPRIPIIISKFRQSTQRPRNGHSKAACPCDCDAFSSFNPSCLESHQVIMSLL